MVGKSLASKAVVLVRSVRRPSMGTTLELVPSLVTRKCGLMAMDRVTRTGGIALRGTYCISF